MRLVTKMEAKEKHLENVRHLLGENEVWEIHNTLHFPGDNVMINDEVFTTLSFEASAVVTGIIGLDEDYNFSVSNAARDFRTNKQLIKKGLDELKRLDLVELEKANDRNGNRITKIRLKKGLVYQT